MEVSTVQLIPAELGLDVPSAAEKTIFRLLRLVEIDGCVALHSLNLSEHEYKICGEIDFVIVGPPGIFVLEVKGGRVALRNGIWVFTDRYGTERRKAEGPFKQAQSATFALLDRLRALLPHGVAPKPAFGWGVVFPDQEFNERSVEWAPEMVLDGNVCRTAQSLETGLRRLIRYWRRKSGDRRPLKASDVSAIRRALRPEFDLVPSLALRMQNLESTHQSLTESQYRVLDMVAGNPRILCAGGAGTGKTFLAAEVARREVAAGRRVLVTCRSGILARFLAEQPGLSNDMCVTAQLGASAVEQGPFDTVVVDEAQDIMNLEDLMMLDDLIVGGLDSGRWRMFYDANNQSGVLGSFDPEAFTLLEQSGAARVDLTDNCRNTRDIVEEVQRLVHADIGVSTAGAGLPVQYTFTSSPVEAAGQLSDHLQNLLGDGVEPGHISILSPLPFEKSCVTNLAEEVRRLVRVLDAATVTLPVNGIGFSSIPQFKGLENRFVCVVDIEAVDDPPAALSLLYVAMTRARAGLWIGFSDFLRRRVLDRQSVHVKSSSGRGA